MTLDLERIASSPAGESFTYAGTSSLLRARRQLRSQGSEPRVWVAPPPPSRMRSWPQLSDPSSPNTVRAEDEQMGFAVCGGHAELQSRPARKVAHVEYPKPTLPKAKRSFIRRPSTARGSQSVENSTNSGFGCFSRRRSSIQNLEELCAKAADEMEKKRQSLVEEAAADIREAHKETFVVEARAAERTQSFETPKPQSSVVEDRVIERTQSFGSPKPKSFLRKLPHRGSLAKESTKAISSDEASWYLRGGHRLPSDVEDEFDLSKCRARSTIAYKFPAEPKARYIPGLGMCWVKSESDDFGVHSTCLGLVKDMPNGPVEPKPTRPSSPEVHVPLPEAEGSKPKRHLKGAALNVMMSSKLSGNSYERYRRRRNIFQLRQDDGCSPEH